MTVTLPRARERTTALPEAGPPPARSRLRGMAGELSLAGGALLALCVAVLVTHAKMLEPDDYAYLASITALADGHLVLSTAQYHALSRQLGDGGAGIVQWTHLSDGDWISQKNPGYPFLAVAFYELGILRLAPLFFGAVACVGLYVGGRRWLGRYGGSFAVALYCLSGAAFTFAWRDTMPSFTDASLVAGGAGFLLWALLAREARPRRRLWVGIAAFVCLDAATFVRYTDVVELAVAAVAVVVFARPAGVRWRTASAWVATAGLFGAGLLVFDACVYGSALATGYTTGQITFSTGAIGPNIVHMPLRLVAAMPMAVPAAVALGWIGWRAWRGHVGREHVGREHPGREHVGWRHLGWGRSARPERAEERRDGMVAATLLVGWAAIWGLYFAYTWTVGQNGGDPVHVVRFYLPAMGLMALLGAWTLTRIPRPVAVALLPLALGLAIASFQVMASGSAAGAVGRPGAGGVSGTRPGAGAPGTGGHAGPPPGTGSHAGPPAGTGRHAGPPPGTGRPPGRRP